MLVFSVILISLLSAGLLFSLVELGLVAFIIFLGHQSVTIEYYCGPNLDQICTETFQDYVPNFIALLMFCAVWSVLVTALAILLPLQYHKQGAHHHNSWLAPSLIIIYFVTWVFWLAAFADYVSLIIGFTVTGIPAAILSFAVLNWVVYMTLFILSFLAIFNVMAGEWPGYLIMRSRSGPDLPTAPPATSTMSELTGAPAAPRYENDNGLTA